jgi:lysophospholipase L1-like esterase
MADYTFESELIADPVTFQRAANAQITVYDVDDTAGATPLVLKDLNGMSLANPLTSSADAFVRAFSTTSPQVRLVGGGLAVARSSYKGMRDEAVEAKEAAAESQLAAQAAASLVGAPADTAVKTLIENGATQTALALDAAFLAAAVDPVGGIAQTFAPARRAVYGPRWVFDGDSITINGISATADFQDRTRSWTSEMARQSMGRIRYVRNAAVSGYRIDQLLARFDTYVTPYDPDVVVLTAGTNDIRQSRTMAQWKTDLVSYFEKCKDIGADLIVGAIWPSSDSGGTYAPTARTWNTELYTWAAENNVQVIPWDTLADPLTGGWPAGWSTDGGLHPTYGTDAYPTIGKFGWQSVEPKAGPAVLRRAVTNGADALANGFFANLTAAQAPPNLTAGTPDTASGTLPAGTYSYKYTSRTYWGESLPSSERSVTLGATGRITITNSTVSGSRGYNVYRKAPGDTTWKYVTFLTPSTTTSFTDDGTLTAGADMPGVDTSQYPTGLVAGSSTPHKVGPVVYAEAGVRGMIFRSTAIEGSAAAPNDHFLVTVAAGEVYSVSALLRTTGTTEGVFIVRFRDSGNVAIGQAYVARDRMVNGWGLAQLQITIPANTATVRISFEQTDSSSTGYAEFAEVQFRKIS